MQYDGFDGRSNLWDRNGHLFLKSVFKSKAGEKVRMRVNGGCASVVPAQAGTSHPCVDVGAVREPPLHHAIPNVSPNPTTTAYCAIAAPAPNIGCIRHSRAEYPSFPRMREPRIPALCPVIPAKAGIQEDEGSGDEAWVEMEANGSELRVCRSWPLAMRPPQSKQGHAGPAIRVSGVPNEATVASFPASQLGVNEANQGQMGPRFTPNRRSPEDGKVPSPLRGEG